MAIAIPIPEKLLNFLMEKVVPVIKTEAQKIRSVPELVEDIKVEVKIAEDFLRKTEEKTERADDQTKKRVRELRELVFKVEDALDAYNLLGQHEMNDNHRFSIKIWKFLYSPNIVVESFMEKHGTACKIVTIKKAMEKIKGSSRSYEESIFNQTIEESDSEFEDIEPKTSRAKKLQDPGFCPLYKDEKELVGFEERKKIIIEKLDMEKKIYSKGLYVLAVWGEPGVGMTTLARKVYEDENVRKHFSCYAWVTATKPYKKADLLKCLFQQFIETSTNKEVTSLGSGYIDPISAKEVQNLQNDEVIITTRLRNYLKKNHPQNRYLVVLDDVSEKERLSRIIKAALVPSDSIGSRILVTTKSEGIANYWKYSSSHGATHNLPFLSDDDAKKLFNMKTFRIEENFPWKLKSLRDEIVKECDGLPGIIEKVGADFSTTQKWIELYHDFQLNPLSPRNKRMLMSKYHEMPYHLKPCFLYLCMFPKGFKLERMRIVRLWIAEGFVKAKTHSTSEEAAEEYINELVDRGMVRPLKKDDTGRTRLFVLPRMWQNIMLPKLAELSFCQVLPENFFSANNNHCRRLSIHDELKDTVIAPSVRSILSFVPTIRFPISWSCPFPKTAFRLKVLDLQNSEFTEIPLSVGILHNLRYMCLRNTKIKELPGTIVRGLWNLETLDLKQTEIKILPTELLHLKKLRHLLVCHYGTGGQQIPVSIPDKVIENLTELQKLVFVDGSPSYLLSGLKSLKQLRRLGIQNLRASKSKDFCDALCEMQELRALYITTTREPDYEVLDLTHISSPPKYLERLYLDGPLIDNCLPEWIGTLEHLVRVRLLNSKLVDDPLGTLNVMQDLLVLELDNVYDGTELDFGHQGWPKLQVLRIRKLLELQIINVGKKALLQLQTAEYQCCPKFQKNDNSIPRRIRDLLKEIP